MRTNKDLLKEVYRLRNLIAGEKGSQQIDLAQIESDYRFQRELRESKGYELRGQIDALNREYTRVIEDKQRQARNDAYFATPEGAAHKRRLEKTIARRQQACIRYVQQSIEFLEYRIQRVLGPHWGVSYYDKGHMTISVIDSLRSIRQQRKYHFGQDIDIWYQDRTGLGKNVRFIANCGTTGSFEMEGGGTVGERALFYVGVGRLFSNKDLVRDIRNMMAATIQVVNNLDNELARLQKELEDPLKKQEQQELQPKNKADKQFKPPKHSRGIR